MILSWFGKMLGFWLGWDHHCDMIEVCLVGAGSLRKDFCMGFFGKLIGCLG